ncbi:hypothetical protein WNY60_00705 [Olleya sp. AS48]
MIIAYAKHIRFYSYQATVDHFADQLKDLIVGKGTVVSVKQAFT